MITIEQEKFNMDIIKWKMFLLTKPIAYWRGEFPFPNIFHNRGINDIFKFIERDPYYAMKSIGLIYSNNFDHYKDMFEQGYRDLMENFTEGEIRYYWEMRGNIKDTIGDRNG